MYTRTLFKTKSKTTYSANERILLWIRKIKSCFLFKSSFLQNLFEVFLPGLLLQKSFQNNMMYVIPRDSQLPGFLDNFFFFFFEQCIIFRRISLYKSCRCGVRRHVSTNDTFHSKFSFCMVMTFQMPSLVILLLFVRC